MQFYAGRSARNFGEERDAEVPTSRGTNSNEHEIGAKSETDTRAETQVAHSDADDERFGAATRQLDAAAASDQPLRVLQMIDAILCAMDC